MLICAKCGREMRVVKNGVGCAFGLEHVYAGDMFECPRCGAQVVKTNASGFPDPDRKRHTWYIECTEGSG